MDSSTLQKEKNAYAAGQDPSIAPCTNESCEFTGCTCGTSCGCGMPDKLASGELQSCDPCKDFKLKKEQGSRTGN